MAIEIGTNSGDSVVLTGADAERFVEETKHPRDDDGRRAEHLRRSAETFDRVYSEQSANELFRS